MLLQEIYFELLKHDSTKEIKISYHQEYFHNKIYPTRGSAPKNFTNLVTILPKPQEFTPWLGKILYSKIIDLCDQTF